MSALQTTKLETQLKSMCDSLRGQMDSNEYKNYILSILFYKYISTDFENYLKTSLIGEQGHEVSMDEIINQWYSPESEAIFKQTSIDEKGFFIEPNHLFSQIIRSIAKGNEWINDLQGGMNDVSNSAEQYGDDQGSELTDLFQDVDLSNNKLGATTSEKEATLKNILLEIDQVMNDIHDSDILGDAYEYLLREFASSAGKKGGEFYTPHNVSKLVARIATHGHEDAKSIYDPTCGSGSLLIQAAKSLDSNKLEKICGQELNVTTYNLARMNMMLHGFHFNQFSIKQGNTLNDDKFQDNKFDVIVANPPFGTKWDSTRNEDDVRFKDYGKLAPKSKGEFAFIQHMVYHLSNEGTMATVAPLGVLFRGAAEETIRKYMIDQLDCIDAVIVLPSNLFYGTGIPACILVCKKNRKDKNIFFIDASNEFEKQKTQNVLTDEIIDKILNTYIKRKDVDKYARNVSVKEIQDNDYNLNIPRYIDTFEEEEPIDIEEVNKQLKELKSKIKEKEEKLEELIKELAEVDNVK